MKKIGFYLSNDNIANVDFTDFENGDPGVGGSEFSAIVIATNLSRRNNNLDVILYCNKAGFFPNNLKKTVCGNLENAIKSADKDDVDYFIVDEKVISHLLLGEYDGTMGFVLWANNPMTIPDVNFYASCKNVKKIINVGKEQMDLWIDHPVYKKFCFIYNSMYFDEKLDVASLNKDKRGHNVVYIGNLVFNKGFHYLAKSWKKVLKSCPNAELYVIGSGRLYDRNAKMGPLGIASASYEKLWSKYVTGDDGKILPSVHFLGILGSEKNEILKHCKVGVPNPSGLTETFGYTAVEMQSMGCNCTTKRCYGYLDTVLNVPTNILYSNEFSLHEKIIKLLNTDEHDANYVLSELKRKFSVSSVVPLWESLFKDMNDIPKYSKTHLMYRMKWLKYIHRYFDRYYMFPSVEVLLVKFDNIVVERYKRWRIRLCW